MHDSVRTRVCVGARTAYDIYKEYWQQARVHVRIVRLQKLFGNMHTRNACLRARLPNDGMWGADRRYVLSATSLYSRGPVYL